jgi:hypothetical protein
MASSLHEQWSTAPAVTDTAVAATVKREALHTPLQFGAWVWQTKPVVTGAPIKTESPTSDFSEEAAEEKQEEEVKPEETVKPVPLTSAKKEESPPDWSPSSNEGQFHAAVAESFGENDDAVEDSPGGDTRAGRTGRSRSRGRNRERSRTRNRGRREHRRRRRTRLAVIPDVVHTDLQRGLVPRSAIPSAAASSAELPVGPLPPSVGHNLMIATWIIGKKCSMKDLGPKLRFAPFDCVFAIMSNAVSNSDPIWVDFKNLSNSTQDDPDPAVAEILGDKAVYRVSDMGFAVVHRAKVEWCTISRRFLRHRPNDGNHQVEAITVHFGMSTLRQRLEQINIGFLTVQGGLYEKEKQALVEWLVVSRIAILTGFFGDNKELVERLATDAGAIGFTPFYQNLWCKINRSRGWECLTHPSYFLLFGFYRAMQWPKQCSGLPKGFELGEDIRNEMTAVADIPEWPTNDTGNTNVPNLGNIKMKPIDWKRWCPHTFQTVLWLGTSIPSKRSQGKGKDRSRGTARGSGE